MKKRTKTWIYRKLWYLKLTKNKIFGFCNREKSQLQGFQKSEPRKSFKRWPAGIVWTLWKSLQAFQTISSPQQGQKFEGPALRDPRKRKHHDREHFGRNWMNENSCGDISLLKLGEGNTFCLDLNLSKHFYSSCHQNQYIFHHLQLSVHCTLQYSGLSWC